MPDPEYIPRHAKPQPPIQPLEPGWQVTPIDPEWFPLMYPLRKEPDERR